MRTVAAAPRRPRRAGGRERARRADRRARPLRQAAQRRQPARGSRRRGLGRERRLRRKSRATCPTARTAAAGWWRALRASSVPGTIRGRRSAPLSSRTICRPSTWSPSASACAASSSAGSSSPGSRSGEDWRIDKLAMTNADASLAASGLWRGGAPTRSQLDFELTRPTPASSSRASGYPNLVKGGKTPVHRRCSPGTAILRSSTTRA